MPAAFGTLASGIVADSDVNPSRSGLVLLMLATLLGLSLGQLGDAAVITAAGES